MSRKDRKRGGVYVDGFNVYHAIDDLGKPYLKWLDLRRLAEIFAVGHAHEIVRIVFCSAIFPGDFGKQKRQEAYIAALKATNVEVLLGHTTKEPAECRGCGNRWDQPREKETDINVALSLFSDAARGAIDVAFLVTADTDQAATLRFMRRLHPDIELVVVTPPGREKSKHLRDLSSKNIALTEAHVDLAVFPAMIRPEHGRLVTWPKEYAPPIGWIHPNDRPAR